MMSCARQRLDNRLQRNTNLQLIFSHRTEPFPLTCAASDHAPIQLPTLQYLSEQPVITTMQITFH